VNALGLVLTVVNADLKKLFELAAKRPVPGEIAKTVKIDLAHVAAEVEPLALCIDPDPILQIRGK
jgi:hypothetical protein